MPPIPSPAVTEGRKWTPPHRRDSPHVSSYSVQVLNLMVMSVAGVTTGSMTEEPAGRTVAKALITSVPE